MKILFEPWTCFYLICWEILNACTVHQFTQHQNVTEVIKLNLREKLSDVDRQILCLLSVAKIHEVNANSQMQTNSKSI